MKKLTSVLLIIVAFTLSVAGQTKPLKHKKHLTESTIVKDSSGMVYPYAVWKNMVSSGDYRVKAIDPYNDSTQYLLVKLDSVQKDKIMNRMSKPKESLSFTNGDEFRPFSAEDIKGVKFSIKDLKGKVVVINFWYTKGDNCQKEIPELNKIALEFANDHNVVFLAIALDKKRDIDFYLEENQFSYHIIESGKIYAENYGIYKYPTNIVLDKSGRIVFNSQGYNTKTPYWIRKSIEDNEK